MSTVPVSSNVMLAGTMLGFFSLCLVITFQAPLIWWAVPVTCVAVVIVIATVRYRKHRRMREALHGARL
jgi:hypothetical protein